MALAGVIAIAAIFLIIWGVTHQKESRPLDVVWTDGQARYTNGPTEESTEIAFPRDQIPITLLVRDADGALYHEGSFRWNEVAATVNDFNTQAGFELFEMVEDSLSSAEAVWGEPILPGPDMIAGSVRHSILPNGDLHAVISLYDTTSISSTRRNIAHELGHVAGLQHSDFEDSLMYPPSREDQMGTSVSSMRLADGDVRLLQKLYRD